ncbi:hypothetical protein G7Y89_g9896 [Cudoniella acicularis]|uniref:Uncharacterized protein n=1 Tax=Cudoniella acicularis TaxID=354080 RepID=A0A8H4RDS1_9HELO|nr:hypothetical protein G7Y89_g9896 [Cudoniella acicularis]
MCNTASSNFQIPVPTGSNPACEDIPSNTETIIFELATGNLTLTFDGPGMGFKFVEEADEQCFKTCTVPVKGSWKSGLEFRACEPARMKENGAQVVPPPRDCHFTEVE